MVVFYKRLGAQLLDARKVSGIGASEVAYGWPDIETLIQVTLPSDDDDQRAANKELLCAFNAAYAEPPSPEEEAYQRGMKAKQRQLAQGEW